MKDIEIEIQAKIEKTEPLLHLLSEHGVFIAEESQLDEYFTPAHRDFTKVRPIREWLRLREEGDRYSITYKNWHYLEDGSSYHCDEYETTIKSLDQVRKIFDALNAKRLVTVNKKRQIWGYQDYEIAIDSVDGLGDFVEIEFKGENLNQEVATMVNEMIQFLKNLGCGKIELNNGGYPYLLLFPEEAEFKSI